MKDIQDKSFFLKEYETLYDLWCNNYESLINENQILMAKTQKDHKNNESENVEINTIELQNYGKDNNNNNTNINAEKEDKMDISIIDDSVEDDILNPMQKSESLNINIDINIKNHGNLNHSDDRELNQNMGSYNDENYSKDLKELKSIYPSIINLYLPNEMEMMNNIPDGDIEINNILTSKLLFFFFILNFNKIYNIYIKFCLITFLIYFYS